MIVTHLLIVCVLPYRKGKPNLMPNQSSHLRPLRSRSWLMRVWSATCWTNTSLISRRIHLKTGRDPDINSLKQRDLRADLKRLTALLCLGHFFLNGTLDSHFSRAVTPTISTILFLHLKRTNLNTLITPDALAFVNNRVFESFFVLNHWDCFFGTNCIASCASTAFFFSIIEYWYLFHNIHLKIQSILILYPTSACGLNFLQTKQRHNCLLPSK